MQLPLSPPHRGAARSTTIALVAANALFGGAAGAQDALIQAVGEPTAYWSAAARKLTLPQGRVELDAAGVHSVSQLAVERSGTQRWTAVATRRLVATGPPEIVVLRGEGQDFAAVAPESSAFPRSAPALLAAGGQLDRRPSTLMWLEGTTPRQHEVRLAHWNGTAFGPAETLVSPGPGSQVGLQARQLADGRLLAVWSAFDGTDTDLLFVLGTRGAGGQRVTWSPPRRVGADNDVPDATPHLAVLPDGGAVLAWSTFDETEYRSVGAFLPAGASDFTRARGLGPKGLLQPRLHVERDGNVVATLLDAHSGRNSDTMTWHAARLRTGGPAGVRVTGRAPITAGPQRPLVLSSDRSGVRLQRVEPQAGAAAPAVAALDWRTTETDQEMPR